MSASPPALPTTASSSSPLSNVPREMLTADGTRLKKKRGGNRKGSSNWKRREQNILLDLMQNAALQWPTKLDDWNALALEFNQRIEAMGFTPRNGKSLRKKWQVLCSAKVPAEGEELTEQEKRAKAISQRGPMGQGRLPADQAAADDESHKRIKLDNGTLSSPLSTGSSSSSGSGSSGASSAGLASSPLAPTLSALPPLPPLPLPLPSSDNAALVAEVHSMLAGREKAREQQVAMFEEWRRRDEQERQQFDRLMQTLGHRGLHNNAPMQPTLPQRPQLSTQPQQQLHAPPQQPQQQQGGSLNGGGKQNV